jgi:hypothetical protein
MIRMKKIMATLLVAAMFCVSFAMGVSVNVQGSQFVEEFPVGWVLGEFDPKDVAWSTNGSICVVVGDYLTGPNPPTNAWAYFKGTDTWTPLSMPTIMQTLYGVCYNPADCRFWFCGDRTGSPPSVAYWYDGENVGWPQGTNGPGYPCYDVDAYDIAAGDGNVAMVGYDGDPSSGFMIYFDLSSDSWYPLSPAISTENHFLNSITFDGDLGMYYAVGTWITTATFWYTDYCPLSPLSFYYPDLSPFPASCPGGFNSIDWNPANGFGLVTGDMGVYKVINPGTPPGSIVMDWSTVALSPSGEHYLDVAWDTDGYREAAIVGYFSTHSAYWRYYTPTPDPFMPGHLVLSYEAPGAPAPLPCVAIKPPASPKWAFVPLSGGGIKFNIMAQDQGTTVNINAAFPHIFSIDFREASTGVSRLNQQVDVDAIYTFVIEANYTVGGVEQWNDVNLNITAWYDEGLTGALGSSPPAVYDETNRTRQFSILYNAQTAITTTEFPNPDMEFFWVDTNQVGPIGVLDRHYFLYINVSFEAQTWAATGAMVPPALGYIWDTNFALNDADSWDFMARVYDRNLGASNESYEEFGVKRAVSIAVAGNPTGNAPPGTNGVVLAPTSQITYSANCNYTLNVSIPDLYLNGVVGPYWIPSTNVYIQNIESLDLVNTFTSEISTPEYFQGTGVEWLVWGNTSNPGAPGPWEEQNPPYNGTNANGPFGSNFNTYIGPTVVQWWANVQAGLPEGTYWAVITFTIWNP